MIKILIILLLMFSIQVSADDKYETVYIPFRIQLLNNEINGVLQQLKYFKDENSCKDYLFKKLKTPTYEGASIQMVDDGDYGLVYKKNVLADYLICKKIYLNKRFFGLN